MQIRPVHEGVRWKCPPRQGRSCREGERRAPPPAAHGARSLFGEAAPWSRLSLPLSPPTTHGVHLAPSRLRAPTGAATCSSPAHGACALRHRDRMAPVVVAANSRGGYSRLPTEQRVTTSSCSARAQRSRESPTRCRMVAVVPMRTCWSRPAATVANADGADGRVKWDRSKRLRRRAACPLVRSPASDGRGSSP